MKSSARQEARRREDAELIRGLCTAHELNPEQDASLVELLSHLHEHTLSGCTCGNIEERLCHRSLVEEDFSEVEPGAVSAEIVSQTDDTYELIRVDLDEVRFILHLNDGAFSMPDRHTAAAVAISLAPWITNVRVRSGAEEDVALSLLPWAREEADEVSVGTTLWRITRAGIFPASPENSIAIAGYEYEINSGSGSPGADDDGYVLLVPLWGRFFVYSSDPDEWSALEARTTLDAITEFRREWEHLRDGDGVAVRHWHLKRTDLI